MSKKTLDTAAGKFYINGGKGLDESLLLENQVAKQKAEKEAEELNRILLEAAKNKQEEINAKLQTLELIPMGNKVMFQAYPQNPYRKIMEGSIIVEFDGSFKNPDSGEWDKQKELVGCAKVLEVGPEVKYIKPGDDIYYDTRTCYPVPFMSLGYQMTSEPQVLCILNEGLKDRFKMF